MGPAHQWDPAYRRGKTGRKLERPVDDVTPGRALSLLDLSPLASGRAEAAGWPHGPRCQPAGGGERRRSGRGAPYQGPAGSACLRAVRKVVGAMPSGSGGHFLCYGNFPRGSRDSARTAVNRSEVQPREPWLGPASVGGQVMPFAGAPSGPKLAGCVRAPAEPLTNSGPPESFVIQEPTSDQRALMSEELAVSFVHSNSEKLLLT